ncbi:hypothetical protein HDU83_004614 [Entophlyctis luteolus]|nr:hypothetical protein HDU83_004614 [Entophlyctis luteolus]
MGNTLTLKRVRAAIAAVRGRFAAEFKCVPPHSLPAELLSHVVRSISETMFKTIISIFVLNRTRQLQHKYRGEVLLSERVMEFVAMLLHLNLPDVTSKQGSDAAAPNFPPLPEKPTKEIRLPLDACRNFGGTSNGINRVQPASAPYQTKDKSDGPHNYSSVRVEAEDASAAPIQFKEQSENFISHHNLLSPKVIGGVGLSVSTKGNFESNEAAYSKPIAPESTCLADQGLIPSDSAGSSSLGDIPVAMPLPASKYPDFAAMQKLISENEILRENLAAIKKEAANMEFLEREVKNLKQQVQESTNLKRENLQLKSNVASMMALEDSKEELRLEVVALRHQAARASEWRKISELREKKIQDLERELELWRRQPSKCNFGCVAQAGYVAGRPTQLPRTHDCPFSKRYCKRSREMVNKAMNQLVKDAKDAENQVPLPKRVKSTHIFDALLPTHPLQCMNAPAEIISTNSVRQLCDMFEYGNLSSPDRARSSVCKAFSFSTCKMLKEYSVYGILGFGSNGAVLAATKNGQWVAIKIIYKHSALPVDSNGPLELRFLRIANPLGHSKSHLVQFIEEWEDARNYYAVTEYFGPQWSPSYSVKPLNFCVLYGGRLHFVSLACLAGSSSLHSWMIERRKHLAATRQNGMLDMAEVKAIIKQIAQGVHEMHSRGYYHGDIKADNVLVRDCNGQLEIRLADYGLSGEALRGMRFYGTQLFSPPEFLEGGGGGSNGLAADIFALGILLFTLLHENGQIPSALYTMNNGGVKYGEVARLGVNFPLDFLAHAEFRAIDLLHLMCRVDRSHRPTIAEVLEHPWFCEESEMDWVVN